MACDFGRTPFFLFFGVELERHIWNVARRKSAIPVPYVSHENEVLPLQ